MSSTDWLVLAGLFAMFAAGAGLGFALGRSSASDDRVLLEHELAQEQKARVTAERLAGLGGS